MAQPPPANQREQTLAAISFLRKVRLRSKPCVYNGLSAVLAEYNRDPDAPTSPVVDSATALLHDQPDLIAEFNVFLPSKYKIKLPDERQRLQDMPLLRAQNFLERVKMEDADLHDRVVVKLFNVDEETWLDAHQVYAQLMEVFGPGRRDLLRDFAEFLPNNPPPHFAEEKPSSKRKRAAAPYAVAADGVKPSRAKKPPAADILQISQPVVDDGDAVKPSRPKKTRNASIQISQHDDGAESDSCWLVTTEDPHVAAVTFRKMWEFHVRYSNLVAAIKRAEELERTRHPQGSFEALFPDRECHEILEELYGSCWRTMQVALEDGERVDVTLATILRRLRAEEDAAVEVVRARRDKARYSAKASGRPACQSGGYRRVIRARFRAGSHET
ncbi:hypothetical protein E2562_005722 [Oryza meyeriana var. granulata]|uniref:Histone deacetylase interacting domain-containing protein n=1 Tax=Oryza meyeriana var. granulata TaxID=110450 RepID=A0A6G1F4D6_9ORYZ|nr:hypothetical protein E2562_005722 [Oryza meyeriana var. granulata]